MSCVPHTQVDSIEMLWVTHSFHWCVYSSCCLAGRAYPMGDIPESQASAVKDDVFRCITSLHTQNHPDSEYWLHNSSQVVWHFHWSCVCVRAWVCAWVCAWVSVRAFVCVCWKNGGENSREGLEVDLYMLFVPVECTWVCFTCDRWVCLPSPEDIASVWHEGVPQRFGTGEFVCFAT